MPYNPSVNAGPVDYDFSVDFDYSVWHADSEITLCNVRWDSAYRSVWETNNPQDVNTYINSLEDRITIPATTMLKPFEGVRIQLPHNIASRFNYLRAYNPAQPTNAGDIPRYFYYFITGVSYIAPDTTELTLQLDVWQSYRRSATFGNCYVERSHLGIANENNFADFGRRYLTVPEGLDTGSEYQTVATRREVVMGFEPIPGTMGGVDMTSVIIVTTQDITAPPGTKDAPNRVTATGSSFQGIASGANYWAFKTQSSFMSWMQSIKETPWIGESVITAFMTPALDRYTNTIQWPSDGTPYMLQGNLYPLKHFLFDAWRESSEILNNIPAKYRHLKKFLTFPYMMIELTTWTGTPITLKPELWASENANVLERVSMIAPGQRLEFHAQMYNSKPGTPIDNYNEWTDAQVDMLPIGDRERFRSIGDDHGDYWDHATKIASLPSVALVNDGAISYLASNAYGIAYQRNSASWDQMRALSGNEATYRNALTGIGTATGQTNLANSSASAQVGIQNRTDAANASVSAGASMLAGLAGGGSGLTNIGIGAISGGISSAGSLINTGTNMAARDESLAVSNSLNRKSNELNNKGTREVNDRNKDLADWAASGDYANKVAGINAKVNDAQMIAPNTSGQVGGETINLANNMVQVSARWKMVDPANMARIGDFWLKYGYAINQVFTPTTLHVMEKFSYWKMIECFFVTAPMPEVFKDALRAIMEKGTTVYADPDDIGTVDIANNPAKAGITL